MDRRKIVLGAIGGLAFVGLVAVAVIEGHHAILRDDEYEDDDEGDRTAVARALTFAKVSLQQGLAASELEGQPISGKFEVDRGNFQLSIYTSKEGRFSEVLVDYATGKVAKVRPITEGDDLSAAQSQSAAMAKAKIALRAAVDRVLAEANGSRVVSVIPNLKDGRAIASVLLFKGDDFQIVNQILD